MKIIIVISVLCKILFSSSSSLAGFGTQNINYDPASIGLGNSSLFSGRYDGFTHSALSTHQENRFVRIYVYNNFSKLSLQGKQNSRHRFSAFGFSFPFKKSNSFTISLSSETRVNNSFIDPEFSYIAGTSLSDALASKNTYDLSGGISNFSIGFSSGYFDFFDFGINLDFLFGSLFSDVTTNIYTFDYNLDNCDLVSASSLKNSDCLNLSPSSSALNNNIYNFNGNSITLDGRVSFLQSKFASSVSIQGPLSVSKDIRNNSVQAENYSQSVGDFLLDKYTVGYQYNNSSLIGAIIEVQKQFNSYSDIKIQILNQNSPSSISYHGGIFKNFVNSSVGFWNIISIRTGFMSKKISYEKFYINDNSISLSFGLKYFNNQNELDISLCSGIRKTQDNMYPVEKYIKVDFGIISGDVWFKKLRRK